MRVVVGNTVTWSYCGNALTNAPYDSDLIRMDFMPPTVTAMTRENATTDGADLSRGGSLSANQSPASPRQSYSLSERGRHQHTDLHRRPVKRRLVVTAFTGSN